MVFKWTSTNKQTHTHAAMKIKKKSKQQNMEYHWNHVRNGWAVVIFVEIILHLILFPPLSLALSRWDAIVYSRAFLKLKCIFMFVVTFIHLYFPFHLIQLKSRAKKNLITFLALIQNAIMEWQNQKETPKRKKRKRNWKI